MIRTNAMATVAAAATVTTPGLALAQTGSPTIDFGVLVSEVALPTIFTLLGLAATWLTKNAANWFGVKREGELIQGLNGLLDQGLAFAEQRAKKLVSSDQVPTTVEVENQKVADAANYVIRTAPKWLKKTGWTQAQIDEWVRGRLDLKTEQASK